MTYIKKADRERLLKLQQIQQMQDRIDFYLKAIEDDKKINDLVVYYVKYAISVYQREISILQKEV